MILESKPTRRHDGHQYGAAWLNYNHFTHQSYVYINIPKNASSWMKQVFTNGGCCFRYDYIQRTAEDCPHPMRDAALAAPLTYVVILRDVVDRWISGIAQAQFGLRKSGARHWRNRGLRSILDETVLDEHTEPQVSFIQGIDLDRTTWIDFHDGLTDTVWAWIDQNLPMIQRCDPDPNWTPDDQTYHFQQFVDSTPGVRDQLMDFYRQDHDLRCSVKYYKINRS